MGDQRKSYTAEFKLKVVLESLQRDTTQEAVCKTYGISSSMLHRWKKEFQQNAARPPHNILHAVGQSKLANFRGMGYACNMNRYLRKAGGDAWTETISPRTNG